MPNEQIPGSGADESEQNGAADYSDEEGVEAEIMNVSRFPTPPPATSGESKPRATAATVRTRNGLGVGVRLLLVLVLLAAIALVLVLIRFTGDPDGVQGGMLSLQATLV